MARQGFTQYGAKNVVGKENLLNPLAPNYIGPVVAPAIVAPTTQYGRTAFRTPAPTLAPTRVTADDKLDGRSPDSYAGNLAAQQAAELAAAVEGLIDGTFIDPPKGYLGGGGGGQTTAQRLARQDAIAGAKGSLTYLQQLLAGAGDKYAPLLAQIAGNQTALEGTVNTNYDTALAALAARVGVAKKQTKTNYDALRDRLIASAPQAFANLTPAQAPTLSQDAVSAYAQAIGAPTQAIGQAAVEAAAPYAGTADAYNRLIEILKANETSGQESRLDGVDMSRQATRNQIKAQNLSSTNALDVQRNAALAQVLQAIQGQQLGISQSQLAYEQSLRQALAGIYGSGYVTPPLLGAN